MIFPDLSELTQILIAVGTLTTTLFVWIRSAAKNSAKLLAEVATEGVKKVTEGVAILTKIDIKVDHIDQRLKEVKSEMVEVQSFMTAAARDSTNLHVRIEDHEKRLTIIETKEN